MLRITLLLVFSTVPMLLNAQEQQATPGTFIVHEWGTFLSVQGSDGKTLGGMVESDEPLPGFVINRSQDGADRSFARRNILSKMETPVTYFYTDRPRYVQFEARMPRGLLTHWYPTITSMIPEYKKGEMVDPAKGSSINFGRFRVETESTFAKTFNRMPNLPVVSAQDPWLSMRQPDSAIVSFATGNTGKREEEKFLFYRGLGAFQLPLHVKSAGQDATLELAFQSKAKQPLAGIFVIEVRENKIRWAELSSLAYEASIKVRPEKLLTPALPLEIGVPLAKQAVARALVQTGLYPKEAQGMVDHWQRSYFTTAGMRVLFMLPRELTDEYIPVTVSPKPTELVRTMVGRIELFTPYSEHMLLRCLEKFQDGNMSRSELNAQFAQYGRFREAILRRLLMMQVSTAIRKQAESMLYELLVMKVSDNN